ncbi:hypothetical protein GCM10009530_57200 [Microbispora corallina]|uniref:Uncharacterized protein n=1 Tax=Microbispora corallina TaxID=83302 RepID=A0ABQ4G3Q3_9ACTN|nr:hypothetical protein [Microbispora corallina]GIH41665.1 hypothetical protein Mco01_46650 [Microbispora corallina]
MTAPGRHPFVPAARAAGTRRNFGVDRPIGVFSTTPTVAGVARTTGEPQEA